MTEQNIFLAALEIEDPVARATYRRSAPSTGAQRGRGPQAQRALGELAANCAVQLAPVRVPLVVIEQEQ